MSAPCSRSASPAGAAVDADDEAEVAGAAGGDAGDGVLDDDGVGGRDARAASAAFRNMSGAGLPAMCSAAATMPSVTTSKRGARPDASSTSLALRDDDTTATFVPGRREVVEEAQRAGVRGDAVAAQDLEEQVVLAVAEPGHGALAGRFAGIAVGERDVT